MGIGPSKNFIQAATERMKKKGTIGSYGKASPGKIARDKAKGGLMAKKATFAQNMANIARNK
jgi:hypothetical protein